MKHFLIVLIGLFVFASCKKEAEPEPVASARVAGTYELTRFALTPVASSTVAGFDATLPRSASGVTVSGTMTVEKFNNRDDAVTVVVRLKATGQTDDVLDLEEFDLTGTGTTLDLTYNGQKYGTADGTTIKIDLPTSAGTYKFEGKRQ